MSNLVSGWRSCGEQTEKKRDKGRSKGPRQDRRPSQMDELKVVSDPERSQEKAKEKKNRSERQDPKKDQAHPAMNKQKVALHPAKGRRSHKERSKKEVSEDNDTQQEQAQPSLGQHDAMYERCGTYNSQINESSTPHNQGTLVYYRSDSNMEGECKNREFRRRKNEDKCSKGGADEKAKEPSRCKGNDYRNCPSRTNEYCH